MRSGWIERGTVMIRLGRAHFAFFRGYLDGLDVGDLATRYLNTQMPSSRSDERPDLRLAKSAVTWIRGQLLVLARRSLAPADIRLLALAPSLLLVQYAHQAPTLEQFREEYDTDGMMGEAELIALYEQAHGDQSAAAERRAARNRRLRQRQQQALNQLEAITARDPQPGDRVDGWLDPALAARLSAVGIDHLAELVALIDRHGYRWYRKVPRIGIKAALQIGRWLQDDTVNTIDGLQPAGRPFQPPRALAPQAPATRRTAMVALEHFCMPPWTADACDGRPQPQQDKDPETSNTLVAGDDVAAINAWLALKPPGSHTWRAYRKEAERLLLWSVLERATTLACLTDDDCRAYRDFLGLLGTTPGAQWQQRFTLPQQAWIGTPGAARDGRFWRPFQGALGAASQRQALTILKGLLQWLRACGYLRNDPMRGLRLPALRQAAVPARALSQAEWRLIHAHLASDGAALPSLAQARLRCLLALAAGGGLRLAELAAARRGDLRAAAGAEADDPGWILSIKGRRGALREVPLDNAVLTELQRYFQQRGFRDVARAPGQTPLLAALPSPAAPADLTSGADCLTPTADESPLSVDRIHSIVKRLVKDVAAQCRPDDSATAARLERASTHWLRNGPAAS